MGRHVVGQVEHHLVDIAPAPAFRRIITLDDWMLRPVKMLGRVTVRRLVTASHVPAGAADPQMHPDVAGLEAFLAAERARRHIADRIKMRAGFIHAGLPALR